MAYRGASRHVCRCLALMACPVRSCTGTYVVGERQDGGAAGCLYGTSTHPPRLPPPVTRLALVLHNLGICSSLPRLCNYHERRNHAKDERIQG